MSALQLRAEVNKLHKRTCSHRHNVVCNPPVQVLSGSAGSSCANGRWRECASQPCGTGRVSATLAWALAQDLVLQQQQQ
jgi:hypothetical protein